MFLMNFDKIFVIDWSKVTSEVIAGLASGDITIRRGLAYWSASSGKNGIAQHLPFVQKTIDTSQNMEQILKGVAAAKSAVAV